MLYGKGGSTSGANTQVSLNQGFPTLLHQLSVAPGADKLLLAFEVALTGAVESREYLVLGPSLSGWSASWDQ